MHRAASVSALALLAGCIYSFTGGGLPAHVDTVAIVALDNDTPEPLLETAVQQELQMQLPRQLSVRLAEESLADAVVRGVIRDYSEAPVSVRPAQGDVRAQQPVVEFEVRITYDLEIYDRTADQIIWRAAGQTAAGRFDPAGGETAREGRERAIEELVRKVIEGAQSQW